MDVSEDLGTALMLENDRVRIWEHRVPAGATGPMHLHRRPYFSVVVRGSSGDTVDADRPGAAARTRGIERVATVGNRGRRAGRSNGTGLCLGVRPLLREHAGRAAAHAGPRGLDDRFGGRGENE